MTATPPLDDKRLPEHGAEWGDGVVLRGRSRGSGVEVEVSNPRGPKPQRVLTGMGDVVTRGAKTYVKPQAEDGEDFAVVAGY